MGYITAFGACVGCKRLFHFHPHRVPSMPVNGVREPICRDCVERVNPQRVANGVPPIEILPGAYDGMDEGEWGDDD